MSPFPIISLIALSTAVSVGLFVRVVLNYRRVFVTRAINVYINYDALLRRLPVNPLTRFLTSTRKVRSLGERAQVEINFSVERVLRYKELSWWFWLAFIIGLSATTARGELIVFGFISFPLALFWPELYLIQEGTRLARSADRELTHAIDLLRLYVAAGQNLEAAVKSVARSVGGFWGGVFGQVIFQLETGVYFEAALERAAERWPSSDFNRLLLALKQSRLLGASLSGTLATQATLSRARRKQLAEEKARTAAVKIAVPLVLCIFPALLIIYLAPAVLRILQGI